jgi:hypothetical protein
MPAVPQSTRNSITLRLLHHGRDHWPALARVTTHFRGPFAYATGMLPDSTELPLCRLRYGGSAHSFGFAIYSAARGRYDDAVLFTGSPVGTLEEALDTACPAATAETGSSLASGKRRGVNSRTASASTAGTPPATTRFRRRAAEPFVRRRLRDLLVLG